MEGKVINSLITSLTSAIELMRSSKITAHDNWDIQNLEKIRYYFTGLKYGNDESWERFFEQLN
jgi:hypothetical protein